MQWEQDSFFSEPVAYKKGDVIFSEGEHGSKMFIILKGNVEVLKKEEDKFIRLATIGPEEIFGEMAFFDASPRSATVRALEDTIALTIEHEELKAELDKFPSWTSMIMRSIINRLRRTDELLCKATLSAMRK